jgi:glycosyltransferase involved in cell wall biosynthesis
MNMNENRRIQSSEYIDVQDGWDYLRKVLRSLLDGCAVHTRVNAESTDLYILAFLVLFLARLWGRPALLTYGGGHSQTYFPAPRLSLRHMAFSLLFRLPTRIYCNSEAVKQVLLTTGIPAARILPIPHTSAYYTEFVPTPLPNEVETFLKQQEGVFFSYVCYRKEFALEFLAETIRRFRRVYPNIGFLWLGPWEREMAPMKEFLRAQQIDDAICLLGSVPHDVFLTILSRSLAYIRTPVTDGVCSSVLESLRLKVPVLASENGARPIGAELWKEGDVDSLLRLMKETVNNHREFVARIPEIVLEDNARKLADDIERTCLNRCVSAA